MGAFDRKYSDDQLEAVERTYKPYKVPASKVVALAASGQLKDARGDFLEPFDLNPHTVRKVWEKRQRESLGQVDSPLADLGPRDSTEALRRRLINVCDAELRAEERKRRGTRDMERIRQIGRAAREAAALPGPKDARPAQPGAKENGQRHGAETKGGLAGAILYAARGTQPAQDNPPHKHSHGESTEGDEAGFSDASHDDDAQDQAPRLLGSRTSDQVDATKQLV